MKKRMVVRRLIVTGLALLLVFLIAAQGEKTQAQTLIKLSQRTLAPNIYFPIVSRHTPPCTVAPTLISPLNGSILDTLIPEFVYARGTADVGSAMIYIADNPGFNSPIVYSMSGVGLGPFTLQLFDNLNEATRYYWRVQDRCGADYSPYSPVFSFTSGSSGVILPAPTLISPENGTVGVGQQVTASWNSVPGAVGYEVWRSYPGGGNNIYFTDQTSVHFGYLDPNTTYEWFVFGYNAYAYGTKSDTWQFTTGAFKSSLDDNLSSPLIRSYTLNNQGGRTILITGLTP